MKPPGPRPLSSSACIALFAGRMPQAASQPRSPAALVMPERSCSPGAQASQRSTLQPAGLACAARHDARALAEALTLAAVEPDWLSGISQGKPGACAQTVPGASQTLTAGAPGAYKEERCGCLTSLNSGAGLAAGPRYPPRGICPTTPHPR